MHRPQLRMIAAALAGALLCGGVAAQDRAEIDRTHIIGNRELPKVLYIVPWKKPVPTEVSPRPLQSVLDEALAPIDRDEFRRQVRYDGLQQARAAAAPPGAAPAATERR